jgi:hypothetical protein
LVDCIEIEKWEALDSVSTLMAEKWGALDSLSGLKHHSRSMRSVDLAFLRRGRSHRDYESVMLVGFHFVLQNTGFGLLFVRHFLVVSKNELGPKLCLNSIVMGRLFVGETLLR